MDTTNNSPPVRDHYVIHMLHPGDYVRTKFECRAAEDAPCRTMCKTCWDECREQCDCDELERTPNITNGNDCNILNWFKSDAPEESYAGDTQPVRGPEPQPILPVWNGDNFEWEYAS